MATKEEIKEISKVVMETLLTSEEFEQIIRQAVEVGFNAGAKAMTRSGGVVDYFYEKEKALETVLANLKGIEK